MIQASVACKQYPFFSSTQFFKVSSLIPPCITYCLNVCYSLLKSSSKIILTEAKAECIFTFAVAYAMPYKKKARRGKHDFKAEEPASNMASWLWLQLHQGARSKQPSTFHGIAIAWGDSIFCIFTPIVYTVVLCDVQRITRKTTISSMRFGPIAVESYKKTFNKFISLFIIGGFNPNYSILGYCLIKMN